MERTAVNRRGTWAALLVGAALAALLAAVASATLEAGEAWAATPTRATIEATQFTVQSGGTGEAFARCPTGKRVVGGGVVQSGEASGIRLLASGPLDATGVTLETNDGDVAKQWYAAVRSFSQQPRTFKVFALCSGTSQATIEATPLTLRDVGQTGEAFAGCPAGKRALGGGVVQSGEASGFDLGASGPLDATGSTAGTVTGDVAKQWYGVVNSSSQQPRTFKVFALCSADSAATIKATAFTVAGNGQAEAFARCASTKRALGGGLVQSGPASFALVLGANGPLDATGATLETKDGDVAKQWYAALENGNSTTREGKVFAICE
jgi:hypothetical protein